MTPAQWHKLHRVLGITAALLVVILAVTGLLLNHTDNLGLDKRFVSADPVLSLYNISLPTPIISFNAGDNRVSAIGDRLFLNTVLLPEHATGLVGAIASADLIIIAVQSGLLLVTRHGELVERLGVAEGLPLPVTAVAPAADGTVYMASGSRALRLDLETLVIAPVDDRAVSWQQPDNPPEDLLVQLERAYRGQGVSVERIILDLHSGRIVGRFGKYIMDLAAIVLLVLAGSGAWMWYRRIRA